MNVDKHVPPPVETTYSITDLTEDEINTIRIALYEVGVNAAQRLPTTRKALAQVMHKSLWKQLYGNPYVAGYEA